MYKDNKVSQGNSLHACFGDLNADRLFRISGKCPDLVRCVLIIGVGLHWFHCYSK